MFDEVDRKGNSSEENGNNDGKLMQTHYPEVAAADSSDTQVMEPWKQLINDCQSILLDASEQISDASEKIYKLRDEVTQRTLRLNNVLIPNPQSADAAKQKEEKELREVRDMLEQSYREIMEKQSDYISLRSSLQVVLGIGVNLQQGHKERLKEAKDRLSETASAVLKINDKKENKIKALEQNNAIKDAQIDKLKKQLAELEAELVKKGLRVMPRTTGVDAEIKSSSSADDIRTILLGISEVSKKILDANQKILDAGAKEEGQQEVSISTDVDLVRTKHKNRKNLKDKVIQESDSAIRLQLEESYAKVEQIIRAHNLITNSLIVMLSNLGLSELKANSNQTGKEDGSALRDNDDLLRKLREKILMKRASYDSKIRVLEQDSSTKDAELSRLKQQLDAANRHAFEAKATDSSPALEAKATDAPSDEQILQPSTVSTASTANRGSSRGVHTMYPEADSRAASSKHPWGEKFQTVDREPEDFYFNGERVRVERKDNYKNPMSLALETLLTVYFTAKAKGIESPFVSANPNGDLKLVSLFYAFAEILKEAGLEISYKVPNIDISRVKSEICEHFGIDSADNNQAQSAGDKIKRLYLFGNAGRDEMSDYIRDKLGWEDTTDIINSNTSSNGQDSSRILGLYNICHSPSNQFIPNALKDRGAGSSFGIGLQQKLVSFFSTELTFTSIDGTSLPSFSTPNRR